MLQLPLRKEDIPALLGSEGAFLVTLAVNDPAASFEPEDGQPLKLDFDKGIDRDLQLGSADAVTLSIGAQTSGKVALLWPSSSPTELAALEEFGLAGYFKDGAHADQLVVVLQIGAEAGAGGELSTQLHPAITVGASLRAGADASFGVARPFAKATPAQDLVKDFFRGLRLPATLERPPAAGEVIVFELGGRLSFGANLSLGYQMAGSGSHTLGQLQLSESYRLGVLAKLGFSSEIAGRFAVEARAGSEPGWARVVVRKSRRASVGVAADVRINGEVRVDGLPGSRNEFLEAVMGLKAKNWLNLFEQAQTYTNLSELEQNLDRLAKSYIEAFTDRTFDQLAKSQTFNAAMRKIKEVATSYRDLDNSAIEIFDRYFDPVAQKLDPKIEAALDKLSVLDSLDELRGKILDSELGEALFLLTDGDPLGWLEERVNLPQIGAAGELVEKAVDTLEELRARATGALDLVRDKAHSRIRDAITLAKSKFPLDGLVNEIADLDLVKLKQMADQRLLGFAERLIGKGVDQLSNSELGNFVNQVHDTLDTIDTFTENLYGKMREALNGSFQIGLQAGYNRSTASDALIDVEINLADDEGRRLMRQAGLGHFGKVLAGFDPQRVRIHSGVLTRQVSRRSTLSFNVVGWHKGWHYQGLRELIVESEQRIQSDANGLLTVTTNLKMDNRHERRRNGERVFTNLVLGFVGQSEGAVAFDPATARYMIDTIIKMSARYQLVFEDDSTTPEELNHYLSFAADFGIVKTDLATADRLLERDAEGNFGRTSLDYDVRFSEEGLRSLFRGAVLSELELRRKTRKLVLASYLKKGGPHWVDTAWAYWTTALFERWKSDPIRFADPHGPLTLSGVEESPFAGLAKPQGQLVVHEGELRLLNVLYRIENDLVDAFAQLRKVISSTDGPRKPRDYEKALNKFGQALNKYDKFDEGDNSFFALLDAWIAGSGAAAVRNSSMKLESQLPGQETLTKMVFSPGSPEEV